MEPNPTAGPSLPPSPAWLWHSLFLAQSLLPLQCPRWSILQNPDPLTAHLAGSSAELAWKGSPAPAGTQGGQHSLLLTRQADIPHSEHQALLFFALDCPPLWPPATEGGHVRDAEFHPPVLTVPLIPQQDQTAGTLQSLRAPLLLIQGGSSALRLSPALCL